MKKYILLFTICLVSLLANAQKIDFILSKDANKAYVFAIYNGLKMDTIAKGNISMMGMGTIHIPQEYKDIPAMGALQIEGRAPINLIANAENFSFEESADNKLTFNGSLENDLFYNKQNEVMKEEYKDSYAQAYVKTMSAVVQLSKVAQNAASANLFDKSSARLAALTDVDVDKLYYSRFWFFVIDGLMRISVGQEGFGNNMIRLLDKTKTDKVYTALVEDLVMVTNQFGMDEAFDVFMPHVVDSKRIEYPQGIVFDAFEMAKIRRGLPAPTVEGLRVKVGIDYTMLMFHQPGCENCYAQLEVLKKKYAFFEEHKVRVVTISGATNEEELKHETEGFLWGDKLCDYKGFVGNNYANFGVIGTPTIYLIDGENIVLGRFARIIDVEKYINEASEAVQ